MENTAAGQPGRGKVASVPGAVFETAKKTDQGVR